VPETAGKRSAAGEAPEAAQVDALWKIGCVVPGDVARLSPTVRRLLTLVYGRAGAGGLWKRLQGVARKRKPTDPPAPRKTKRKVRLTDVVDLYVALLAIHREAWGTETGTLPGDLAVSPYRVSGGARGGRRVMVRRIKVDSGSVPDCFDPGAKMPPLAADRAALFKLALARQAQHRPPVFVARTDERDPQIEMLLGLCNLPVAHHGLIKLPGTHTKLGSGGQPNRLLLAFVVSMRAYYVRLPVPIELAKLLHTSQVRLGVNAFSDDPAHGELPVSSDPLVKRLRREIKKVNPAKPRRS